ncbi:hypothetical protein RPW65_07105 [Pseudomonas sp. NyZ704]|nr:hypothetical protein RPW65_07105 [Pseudomonas sp. NyZ704]
MQLNDLFYELNKMDGKNTLPLHSFAEVTAPAPLLPEGKRLATTCLAIYRYMSDELYKAKMAITVDSRLRIGEV